MRSRYPQGAVWPTASERALLRAALLDGESARDALRDWAQRVRLDEVAFRSQCLLPVLHHNLEQRGLPAWEPARLRGFHRRAWFKGQLVRRAVMRALAALEQAGLPSMVIRDLARARYYPDPASRVVERADLVVPESHRTEARTVLCAAGWSRLPGGSGSAVAMRVRAGAIELGLHGSVMGPYSDPLLEAGFWQRSQQVEMGTVLSHGDELLLTIVWGLSEPSMQPALWVSDAAMQLRKQPARIHWQALCALAAELRMELPLREGLDYLRNLLGTQVPVWVTDQLGCSASASEKLQQFCNQRFPPGRYWFLYRRACRRAQRPAGPVDFAHWLMRTYAVLDTADMLRRASRQLRAGFRYLTPRQAG